MIRKFRGSQKNITNFDQVQKELTGILYQNLLFGFAALSLISLILLWQLQNQIKDILLLSWFIALNINLLIGVFVVYFYQKTSDRQELIRLHPWAYIIGSSITAILFGILGSFLMPGNINHQLLIILIILSITGAAVQNLHASYLAACLYILFSLVPLIIWEISKTIHFGSFYFAVLLATLIFLSYLIMDVYSGYKKLVNNIQLKIINIEIARTISHQKALMEALSNIQTNFQKSSTENELFTALYDGVNSVFKSMQLILYMTSGTGTFIFADKRNVNWNVTQVIKAEQCDAIKTSLPYHSRQVRCSHLQDIDKQTLCIPLIANEECLGVMNLLMDTPLTNFEENFFYRISSIMAQYLNNLKLREKLNNALIHDSLTNLYNRYYLDLIIKDYLENAMEHKETIQFILLDIDYFKEINDTFGHAKGDIVLKEFAQQLKSFFSEFDLLFRYGGEEFLVILPNESIAAIIEKMNLFRTRIKENLVVGNERKHKLSFSAGIATFPQQGMHFNSIIKAADDALYEAKKMGRDRIVVAASHVIGRL